eukprot:jgi/Mesen1/6327/ME000328S05615
MRSSISRAAGRSFSKSGKASPGVTLSKLKNFSSEFWGRYFPAGPDRAHLSPVKGRVLSARWTASTSSAAANADGSAASSHGQPDEARVISVASKDGPAAGSLYGVTGVGQEPGASGRATLSSTLGIPPAAPWVVPSLPQSPAEIMKAFASQEARTALGSPRGAAHAAYGAARTLFFLGQAFYTARSIGYRSKEGVFKEGVPTNPRKIVNILSSGFGKTIAGIAELYRRDADNVRRGYYRAPYDMSVRHRQWDPRHVASGADAMVKFARDNMERRKREGRHEVRHTSDEAKLNRAKYPDYYLQNFHFQDGWLSDFSAETYEVATETLFSGSQDAMQRGGLVPLHFFMKGRSESKTHLLELACGTGRYLTFIKDNYPHLRTTAVDLSPFYLKKAQENMNYFIEFDKRVNRDRKVTPTEFLHAAAESLPLPALSVDVVSCVYLFHELPRNVRKSVVREMARVLRPGGIVILTDSLQKEDQPEVDHSVFPRNYHEPYYLDYVGTDLADLFTREGGMRLESQSILHFSKTLCFRK